MTKEGLEAMKAGNPPPNLPFTDRNNINTLCLADIAFQLTRIADALEGQAARADFQEVVDAYKDAKPTDSHGRPV